MQKNRPALLLSLLLFVAAAPSPVLARSNTALARPGAALARLRADLAGPESATQVLTRWCAALKLAPHAHIRAVRLRRAGSPAPWVRARLRAAPHEDLRYRRVRLMCGSHILSEADNWYRPARLTARMNHVLDNSEQSFGAVVRPLDFHRRTLDAVPWPDRQTALRLTAVLETPDGTPFSLVIENYRPILVTEPGIKR